MRTATITEVKNRLSSIIDRVRSGETIVVTDRGQPVARIEPVRADADDAARIARLERSGVIRSARSGPPPASDPIPLTGASAVDTLLEPAAAIARSPTRRDGRPYAPVTRS